MHKYKDLGFELDIFIPELRAGIEYDGFYWHKDKITQDTKKYEKAKGHGIFLIRVGQIPEVPADRVFIAKQLNFTVAQKVIGCLRDLDLNFLFSKSISNYLSCTEFQNFSLFKTTYDAMRKRSL